MYVPTYGLLLRRDSNGPLKAGDKSLGSTSPCCRKPKDASVLESRMRAQCIVSHTFWLCSPGNYRMITDTRISSSDTRGRNELKPRRSVLSAGVYQNWTLKLVLYLRQGKPDISPDSWTLSARVR